MIIELSAISKTFQKGNKRVEALKDISLEIEEGEFLIITGPSGSGKSTLLSIIGGHLTPDSGQCYILGNNLYKMKEHEKSLFRSHTIGYHFQSLALIPTLTILENSTLPLLLSGAPTSIAKKRARIALAQVGIQEHEGFLYPHELSYGERQLAALARALVHEPKILILDEPVNLIDHPLAVKIFTSLHQLALDHGTTIIASIHDIRLHPFAHRVLRLKSGEIIDIAGEALLSIPQPPFLQI